MSENGLMAVTTTDVVEIRASEGKCLFDGIDYTCKAVGDMKDLCHTTDSHEQLDAAQTNACNGLESCENGYTDSGISNSADMDICSMELLDDSEANEEGCTICEENDTRQEELSDASEVKDTCIENTKTDNVTNNLCPEPKINGDETVVENVSSEDPSAGNCTVNHGTCNIDTFTECSSDVRSVNNDDFLPANTANDSVLCSQHSVETTGDDSVLNVKVDDSTCHSGVLEVSISQADDNIETRTNMTEAMSTEVMNLPAEKSLSEASAVETGENTLITSAASSQSQSQPTFATSRSVPRPSQHTRPRVGSYGSPPPSSTCTDDDDASKQQYVVNVHVNPGETFSVCVSNQVQLIQGNLHSFIYMHLSEHFLSLSHLVRR